MQGGGALNQLEKEEETDKSNETIVERNSQLFLVAVHAPEQNHTHGEGVQGEDADKIVVAEAGQDHTGNKSEQKGKVQIDDGQVHAGEVAGIGGSLFTRGNSAKTLEHTDAPAFALIIQAVEGGGNNGVAHRLGFITGHKSLFQKPIGKYDILAQNILPTADFAYFSGVIGAKRALCHEGRVEAALKAFDSGDTEQIVVVLHFGKNGFVGVVHKEVSGNAGTFAAYDMVHDSLYCVLFQIGVCVHGEKIGGANQLQSCVQSVCLAGFVTVKIFHRTVGAGMGGRNPNLLLCVVGGCVVDHNQADMPGIALLQNSMDGTGDVMLLIVGAHDNGCVLRGIGIRFEPLVHQVGKEHSAH